MADKQQKQQKQNKSIVATTRSKLITITLNVNLEIASDQMGKKKTAQRSSFIGSEAGLD